MNDDATSKADRVHWEARYRDHGDDTHGMPSSWVVAQCLTLPPRALVLDLAGGVGRHAGPIARSGRRVIVLDFIERAVAAAVGRDAALMGIAADVREMPIRDHSLDAVVCVNFLDRSLFPTITSMLRSGGMLVYETFTRAHLDVVARGQSRGPRNPAYLLEPGELPRLVTPLMVEQHEERLVRDDAGERHVARVVARSR